MGLPWYLGNSRPLMMQEWSWGLPGIITSIVLWSVVWTGLAIWHAARREEKGWFIFFLLVHTAGIIELLYLVFVVKAFSQGKKSTRRKNR